MKAALVGKEWETHLTTRARFEGIVPISLDRKASWTPRGFQKQKAQFDFIFIGRNAKVICFDAKTTGQPRFQIGKINTDQLKHLMDAGQNCPAGYLVWFRRGDKIVWLNWQVLFQAISAAQAILPENGVVLGGFHSFKLAQIFEMRG